MEEIDVCRQLFRLADWLFGADMFYMYHPLLHHTKTNVQEAKHLATNLRTWAMFYLGWW